MMNVVTPRKGTRAHSIFTATATPQRMVEGRPQRRTITFQNQGSATVYIGDQTVTASGSTRGYALFAGASFTDNASDGEWWVVASTSTQAVHIIDVS